MTVATAFERARSEGRAALVGYLPAGFPDVAGGIEALRTMVDAGCDVIEVGLPYSDPVMDGPTIQAAAQQALEGGIRTRDVLRTVDVIAATGTPTVVMTYWNPVDRYGVARFAQDLASAGGAGLITPDLTPDGGAEWIAAADAHDLDKIFLVAPSSTDERIAMTTAACRGFVYATAVMGVTGARTSTSDLAGPLVARTKALSPTGADLPVAVGLGVSNGDQAAEVASYADGVIVGSAFVRVLLDHADDHPAGLRALAALTEDLAGESGVPDLLGRALVGALAAALLAGCGGGPPEEGDLAGAVLTDPYVVPATELVDTGGDSFSLAKDTDARLTLVFFGYTHCPDICQVVMSSLASAMTRLSDADRADVEVLFVTTDPARDDEQAIRDYLDRFDPEFEGLTGDLATITDIGGELGIAVEKGDRLPSGGYEVTHSTPVIGIDADDQVPILWPEGTSAAELAADVHTLLTGEVT